MATLNKRFTISLTPELEKDLDKLKKEIFYNTTQSEMTRYLLKIGVQEMNNLKFEERYRAVTPHYFLVGSSDKPKR